MAEQIAKFTNLVNNLSVNEILIIVVITAFLLLFIVYRKFGAGAAVALIIAYFIGYVIYHNKILDFYNHQTAETNSRLKAVEEELRK